MICIIDDNTFVRDATVDLLNSLGHAAVAFESAESFLDSGRVNDVVCLILDQNLRGLSGLELQSQLLGTNCPAAIIFLSAFPDPRAREQALNAGAVAYLSKPCEQEHLILALKGAVSRQK